MTAELSLSWSSLRINFWHFDFTSLTVKGQSYKTKINKYDCLTLMVPYAFSSDNYMKKGAGGKKLLDFSYFIINPTRRGGGLLMPALNKNGNFSTF